MQVSGQKFGNLKWWGTSDVPPRDVLHFTPAVQKFFLEVLAA